MLQHLALPWLSKQEIDTFRVGDIPQYYSFRFTLLDIADFLRADDYDQTNAHVESSEHFRI